MAIDLAIIRRRIQYECDLSDHDTPREQIVRRELARAARDSDSLEDLKILLEAYWLGAFDG